MKELREAHVGLVTVFHVNDLLPHCQTMGHIIRLRAEQERATRGRHRQGLVQARVNYRGRSISDTGYELSRQRTRILAGDTIATYLAEPRLVYIPDEVAPKAKWKVEFRRAWPDATGIMDVSERAEVIDALRQSLLQIAGLWLNPSVDPAKFGDRVWLNVVLSVCRIPRVRPNASIVFERRDGHLWARW